MVAQDEETSGYPYFTEASIQSHFGTKSNWQYFPLKLLPYKKYITLQPELMEFNMQRIFLRRAQCCYGQVLAPDPSSKLKERISDQHWEQNFNILICWGRKLVFIPFGEDWISSC